jgi:hypothetical protein
MWRTALLAGIASLSLCATVKAGSLVLFLRSSICQASIQANRIQYQLLPTRRLPPNHTTIQNEVPDPPRRHDGAILQRCPRRQQEERGKQVLEEQEGQAPPGSVSTMIVSSGKQESIH